MGNTTREKRCSGECKRIKPLEAFARKSSNKDGRNGSCKACVNRLLATRNYGIDTTISEKCCTGCKLIKTIDQFSRDRRRKDGLQDHCKSCQHEHYRINNPLKPKRITGNYPVIVTEKLCTKCKLTKRADLFRRNPKMKCGLDSWCIECHHKYRIERDDSLRQTGELQARRRQQAYGITNREYDERQKAQGGVCICGNPPGPEGLHVDHDHETGEVRGLLCGPCNRTIGMARESPARLIALALYLGASPVEVMLLGFAA